MRTPHMETGAQREGGAGATTSPWRNGSLRRLIGTWIIGTVLMFALLAAGLIVALHRENTIARDQWDISRHDQLALTFELEALAANSAPLPGHWQKADQALAALRGSEPRLSLPHLVNAYTGMKREYDKHNPRGDEVPFLDALRDYRAQKTREMTTDQRTSTRLNSLAQLWALGLAVLALFVIALEGRELWQRLFKPMLALTRAAQRIEAGDLSTRVAVHCQDELGELTQTFNEMTAAMDTREKERLHFVATVAHDLKNPLTVVGGVAILLANKPNKFTPDEQQEWLLKIGANSRRMEDIIADLTDGVQAQTGTLVMHMRHFDFSTMARQAVQDAQQIFPNHPLTATVADGINCKGDRARLERVLTNLLSNAAKYSPTGKPVRLSVELCAEELTINVRDEGYGIAPDDLQRLFLPFSRLERTAHKAPGTGLGLATVKKIIEAHGGRIEVTSELERGTTFRVCLPQQLVSEHSNGVPMKAALGV